MGSLWWKQVKLAHFYTLTLWRIFGQILIRILWPAQKRDEFLEWMDGTLHMFVGLYSVLMNWMIFIWLFSTVCFQKCPQFFALEETLIEWGMRSPDLWGRAHCIILPCLRLESSRYQYYWETNISLWHQYCLFMPTLNPVQPNICSNENFQQLTNLILGQDVYIATWGMPLSENAHFSFFPAPCQDEDSKANFAKITWK